MVGVAAKLATGAGGTLVLTTWLAFGAVTLATINVVGGFLVTNRMLAMFQARRRHPTDPDG